MTTLADSAGHGNPSQTSQESDTPGLGALLRRAREHRGLTLEQVSNETRIPRRHLAAFEHDNLAVGPDGFYRRAQIRAYARAIHFDQNLWLTELGRAAIEGPQPPRSHEFARTRQRVLIAIGVVVAAAVFGRAMAGRQPALDRVGQQRGTADSPQLDVPSVPELPPHAVVETNPPTPPDRVAPSAARLDDAAIARLEPPGTRAPTASKSSEPAITADPVAARASPDTITELVVTTEPAGARVTVNGIGWGVAPVKIRHLPAGDKRIRVSKEGYATQERMIHLAQGQQKVLDFQLGGAP